MTQPNFVVFLTDDQGYGDLSCMDATDVKTPHLDRLAAAGARFTNWYSNSPVCSPSRASLLTGCYPGNAGVRSILRGSRTTPGLPPGVPTLATALKPLGYRTAMFGRWHLGLAEGSRPHDHGFDEWFGFLAGCVTLQGRRCPGRCTGRCMGRRTSRRTGLPARPPRRTSA